MALKFYSQIIVCQWRGLVVVGFVAKQKCLVINVVYYDVQIAVIVKICVGCPVGKRRYFESPRLGYVFKFQIAPIAKQHVRFFYAQQVFHFFELGFLLRFCLCIGRKITLGLPIGVAHKIEVGNVFSVAIGNEQVAFAVVVKVGKKRGPAPIGGINARHLANFAVNRQPVGLRTTVELERVAHKLGLVAVLQRHLKKVVIGPRKHRFLAQVIVGHHVHVHDFGQPVVVDVHYVAAH